MRLTPTERDRLLLFSAAELARTRRRRGCLLNVVEATAIVADTVCEAARDGARLTEAVEAGRRVLTPTDLLPDVPRLVPVVRVEAVFDDGSRLAVVRDPFRLGDATASQSAPGRSLAASPRTDSSAALASPGVTTADVTTIEVTNTSLVPISVTSRFHFFEVNPALRFDRAAAYGKHLAVPASTTVRFDPHQRRSVSLTPIGGRRVIIGFAGLVDGPLDAPGGLERAMERIRARGYADTSHQEPGQDEAAR